MLLNVVFICEYILTIRHPVTLPVFSVFLPLLFCLALLSVPVFWPSWVFSLSRGTQPLLRWALASALTQTLVKPCPCALPPLLMALQLITPCKGCHSPHLRAPSETSHRTASGWVTAEHHRSAPGARIAAPPLASGAATHTKSRRSAVALWPPHTRRSTAASQHSFVICGVSPGTCSCVCVSDLKLVIKDSSDETLSFRRRLEFSITVTLST